MDDHLRVCPFCGAPPGSGVFCAACGRTLADVERLPTRAEWEAGGSAGGAGSPEETSAETLAAFLARMHAAGDPGAVSLPMPRRGAFKRVVKASGWIVRPVDREDFEGPRRYTPGLFLTTEGRFHPLDSELRGWGQRDFPRYLLTIGAEPIEEPGDPRLADELAAALAAAGA